MNILVCGGRDFWDRDYLCVKLDAIHFSRGIDKIITGAANGADWLALMWARDREIPFAGYPAQWNAHGKGAGPIRNQHMLDEEIIHGVVAFPGGVGTADMVRRAQEADLPIWDLRSYKPTKE